MARHSSLPAFLGGLFVLAALSLAATTATAQEREINCMGCHEDVHFDSTAHAEIACKDCHTNVTRPRHKKEDLADLAGDAICAQCHTVATRVTGRSVHADTVGCMDCHGGAHVMLRNNDLHSPMSPVGQVQACGGCHAELPGQRHMIESYVDSVHGRGLLRSGLIGSPTCSTCHGAHNVFPIEHERSPTSFKNSPQMCGDCHAYILEEWRDVSAHGAAWKEGNTETATCVDCHSSHEIGDPVVGRERLGIIDECGDCHGEYHELYRGDFHGKATNLGLIVSATCADCHHPHATLGNHDPRSTIHPDNLQATCGDCHGSVTMGFASYNPHIDASDPSDNFYVYLIAMAMHALIIGVFGFFGIHAILWLQRGIVGLKRGEFVGHHSPSGQYVRRFKKRDINMHLLIIVTFLLLAATGLPLKFSYAPWAQTVVDLFGGVENTMFLHRLAAIGTFGYFVMASWHPGAALLHQAGEGLVLGPELHDAATEGRQGHRRDVQVLPVHGPAAGRRPLDLLGEVRLPGGVLGHDDHRRLRPDALVPELLHRDPAAAGLGAERRLRRAQRGGAAGDRLHLPVPLLPYAPAAGELPAGSGDLHRQPADRALQGRAAAGVPADGRSRHAGGEPRAAADAGTGCARSTSGASWPSPSAWPWRSGIFTALLIY
jgi:hypothetical protein